MDKKSVLKALAISIGAVCFGGINAFGQEQEREKPNASGNGKILIAYFSKTGNTRAVAEEIQQTVGGEIFQITTVAPYPENYQTTTGIARQEQNSNARPQLASAVSDMDSYSTIYLGYPIWWGTMPMAVFTFLEQYDFTGKTIAPFCTHGGSGLGRGPADIQRLAPQATVAEGLAVRGDAASNAKEAVSRWLQRISTR